MTYAQNFWIFSVLLFGIIIVPGMDMFFIVASVFTSLPGLVFTTILLADAAYMA